MLIARAVIQVVVVASIFGCSGDVREVDSGDAREETEHLVDFLRGVAELRSDLLADSVIFQVAPEGGGERRVVSRDALRDAGEWYLGSWSLVPSPELDSLTLAPGSHFNCMPVSLASRDAALALFPHVGARLTDATTDGCLRTWNATFVFDGDAESPELIAVVYDQWEW